MRYKLDANGYVDCVLWGCQTGNCQEYTGEIPTGYETLSSWADNALINAYYVDSSGNLVLDSEREAELKMLIEQQTADNTPVLRKDLYEVNEVLEEQYKKNTVSGTIITINNARNVPPIMKITGIEDYNSIDIFAQGKNMLRNDAKTETINGVTFTRLSDGGIDISGAATADIEYVLCDSDTPICALQQGVSYFLDVSSFACEFYYSNGETVEQVFSGYSGQIILNENKKVTQIKLKIPSGQSVNNTIYPILSYGVPLSVYEEYKSKLYSISFDSVTDINAYILISEGLAVLYANGSTQIVGDRNIGLLNGLNIIYTDKANTIDLTYTTNEFLVEDLSFLQGKATTTNKFKILEDGSIEANNGSFSGILQSTSGSIGDWNIVENGLWCSIIPPYDYTSDDVLRAQKIIIGEITPTAEDLEKLDADKNGTINSGDVLYMQQCVSYNLMKSNPGKLLFDTSDFHKPIKIINGLGEVIASFGIGGASPKPYIGADYVIDEGVDGIWRYRKWNNGKSECWCRKDYTTTAEDAFGSLYRSDTLVAPDYPTGLFATATYPYSFLDLAGNDGYGAWLVRTTTGKHTEYAGKFHIYRAVKTTTSITCPLRIYAYGRWE